MSTATAIRTQEKTGTWASIFTNEQVTEQQSALFVKKLLAVAISNITYLRAIFPERAFGDRCLEDLNLKILRDDSSCPGACQVIKWIKGCFDALDKKYLRQLIIGIYIDPNDLDTVIESYTLKFFYTKEGGIDIYRDEKKIASAYTASETKKATIKLIRTIVVLTHTLKPLPEDVMMTIKLLYYDEVTPTDYEPPGFKPSEHDSFNFAEEPINLKLGDVSTPFHTVKMRIKTDKSQFEMKETIEEEVENETECKKISNDSLDKENGESNMSENVRKLSEDYVPVNGHYTTDAVSTSSSAKSEEDCSKNQTMTVTQGENVRCPCGCNEDDGLMILCGVCKYWQHAVCFLITKEEEAPSVHVCDVCAEPGNPEKEPTDSFLVGCSSIVIQATCLWRRALITCSEISRVLPPAFARRLGIEMTVAQGLINRLEKEGYIKNPVKGKRLGKPVNKEKLLNEGIPKYFKKKPISSCNVKSSTKSKKMEVSESQNIVEVSDTEVDNLTERTKDITLFGKKKKSLKSRKSLEETKIKTNKSDAVEKNPMPNKDTETFARETRSRKRALSVTDTETEFDICHSQDTTSNEGSKQRKKSSIADNAILV